MTASSEKNHTMFLLIIVHMLWYYSNYLYQYQKFLCSYYQVCMYYAFVTNYLCAMTVVKLPWQKCLVEQLALTNPGLGMIEKLHKSNTNLANLTGEDKFFHTVRDSLRELE